MDINITSGDNSTQHQSDNNWALMDEHWRLLYERIPVIVVMCFTAITGIRGNILTIVFYTKKAKQTPSVLLIKYLAIFDLIVCFLATSAIADVSVNILFKYGELCKMMYFLNHWFIETSVLILGAIAIDRHRKMCKPFDKQFTNRSAYWTVIALATISMALSAHNFVTYDVVQVNMSSNVTGHYCKNTSDEKFHTVVMIFHVLDACSLFGCLLLFITTYGSIWFKLRQHNKSKIASTSKISSGIPASRGLSSDAKNTISNNQANQSCERVNQSIERLQIDPSNQTVRFSLGRCEDKIANSASKNGSMKNTTKKRSDAPKHSQTVKSERRMTVMMFAVTIGFCMCFIPYVIAVLYVRFLSDEADKVPSVLVDFARHASFLNSVINPIIFCAFNTQYRQYVKNVFTKCKIC